jgi:hypothetical protein
MNTNRNVSGLPAERLALPAGRNSGFYYCSHCCAVATPSVAQVEVAENAPDANPTLKCPHCHKYTVRWRTPLAAHNRQCPTSVSAEHGRELFAGIFRQLAAI